MKRGEGGAKDDIFGQLMLTVVAGDPVVVGRLDASQLDPLARAGLALDVAAPLEPAVAAPLHQDHLPLHLQPAGGADGRALGLLHQVGWVLGVKFASSSPHTPMSQSVVDPAVVGTRFEENQFPLLDLLRLNTAKTSCPPRQNVVAAQRLRTLS